MTIRQQLETALFNQYVWKAEHEGSIARKIACAGRKTRPLRRQILRSFEPVKNSNLMTDSKGQTYKYLRTGQIVKV